jgi:hypothetical protein
MNNGSFLYQLTTGVYIFDYFTPPPPWGGEGGEYDGMGIWGKNLQKGNTEKRENKGKKEEKGGNLKKQDYCLPTSRKQ